MQTFAAHMYIQSIKKHSYIAILLSHIASYLEKYIKVIDVNTHTYVVFIILRDKAYRNFLAKKWRCM